MKRAILIGTLVGLFVSAAGTALGAWFVESTGESAAQLATLQPIKVESVMVGDAVFPGQTLGLAARLNNPNPVPIEIANSELTSDIETGDAVCDEAFTGSKKKYLDNDGLVVDSGESKNVVLGRIPLPKSLPDRCQGREVKAKLTLTATFGS
jgi:hypothetical protein